MRLLLPFTLYCYLLAIGRLVNVLTAYLSRSICPGKVLAEETLFLTMSRILALFEIAPAQDLYGKPVLPRDEMTGGGITCVSSLLLILFLLLFASTIFYSLL